MILVAPPSPHALPNTTPAERDRVAAAFDDAKVNRLAERLHHQIERGFKDGGVRGLIAGAIHIAANGLTSDGAVQGLVNVTPSHVARALEVLIQAGAEERETERERAAKHREAQRAARSEWDELAAAVRERQNSAAAELANISQQQKTLLSGDGGLSGDARFELQMLALRTSGLDEMAARELLQKAVGATKAKSLVGRDELNARAAAIKARLDRYQLFNANRHAHYWAVYDCDAELDALLEATAARLGITAPETPIEVPAA